MPQNKVGLTRPLKISKNMTQQSTFDSLVSRLAALLGVSPTTLRTGSMVVVAAAVIGTLFIGKDRNIPASRNRSGYSASTNNVVSSSLVSKSALQNTLHRLGGNLVLKCVGIYGYRLNRWF